MVPVKLLQTLAASAALASPALAQCQLDKLLADDGERLGVFGKSIAVRGDRALFGADQTDSGGRDRGAAYVFERAGSTWVQAARLAASDAEDDDRFGGNVELGEDVAFVGCTAKDGYRGAVYAFEPAGTSWIETQKLTAGDAQPAYNFGGELACEGDTLVIGCQGHDGPGDTAGSAYVFQRGPSGWVQRQQLFASDAAADGNFGSGVALEGNTLLVGALWAAGAAAGAGGVYVFERPGGVGLWTETGRFFADDGALGDLFGADVELSGDTAIANAPVGDAAYVFERSGSTWNQAAKLSIGDVSGYFGWSAHLAGDLVAVGYPDFEGERPIEGAVYFWKRDASGWTPRGRVGADDAYTGWGLGRFVVIEGSEVFASAPGADEFLNPKGAVYVFSSVFAETTTYCTSAPSSVGPGARIGFAGSTSVAAGDLVLSVSGAVPGQSSLFYYGGAALELPFGDGFRCVGAGESGIARLFPVQTVEADGSAMRAFASGAALSTLYFQFWYRDPLGPGGAGFNLSDGLCVGFCP